MIFTNLDIICRRALLENNYPIHWYAEYLFNASTCLRELTIEMLRVVNTKRLPISAEGYLDLPDDYLDDVSLAFDLGATLQPIPHKSNLNPLQIHNTTTGAFERQPSITNVGVGTGDLFYPFVGYAWYWNVSDYGEPTGRVFGANGGNPNGYAVFKERRQIQVYSRNGGDAILQYISDGQSIDSASMVDTMAFDTIQKYITWKTSRNANNEFSPEGRMYYNAKRKLKGRMNEITVTDIRNILHSAYMASAKN